MSQEVTSQEDSHVITHVVNPEKKSEVLSDAFRLNEYIKNKIEKTHKSKRKVAIFTHATPDPDAIASQVAMRHLLANYYGLESDCFRDGDLSHPQNKATVQLLDPHLIPVDKYKKDNYLMNILVDTVPDHAGVGDHDIEFDIVVDHHKELPSDDFKGLCIHHHSGSCVSILYRLLEEHDAEWDDDNEEHVKVASAILVGVITDTDFCTKLDTTKRDFEAQQNMFRYADITSVRKIVRFNWPMSWVKLMGVAINEYIIEEGVAVVGLGYLESEQHDAIAAIADWMLTWGTVNTAVAFAVFDGKYISGCMRTVDDTIEVHAVCAQLGGEHGEGGGKMFAGRYCKPLGAFEFETDESQDVVDKWWVLQKKREITKILKVVQK